jgi:hypothetical protein
MILIKVERVDLNALEPPELARRDGVKRFHLSGERKSWSTSCAGHRLVKISVDWW